MVSSHELAQLLPDLGRLRKDIKKKGPGPALREYFSRLGVPGECLDYVDLEAAWDSTLNMIENLSHILDAFPCIKEYLESEEGALKVVSAARSPVQAAYIRKYMERTRIESEMRELEEFIEDAMWRLEEGKVPEDMRASYEAAIQGAKERLEELRKEYERLTEKERKAAERSLREYLEAKEAKRVARRATRIEVLRITATINNPLRWEYVIGFYGKKGDLLGKWKYEEEAEKPEYLLDYLGKGYVHIDDLTLPLPDDQAARLRKAASDIIAIDTALRTLRGITLADVFREWYIVMRKYGPVNLNLLTWTGAGWVPNSEPWSITPKAILGVVKAIKDAENAWLYYNGQEWKAEVEGHLIKVGNTLEEVLEPIRTTGGVIAEATFYRVLLHPQADEVFRVLSSFWERFRPGGFDVIAYNFVKNEMRLRREGVWSTPEEAIGVLREVPVEVALRGVIARFRKEVGEDVIFNVALMIAEGLEKGEVMEDVYTRAVKYMEKKGVRPLVMAPLFRDVYEAVRTYGVKAEDLRRFMEKKEAPSPCERIVVARDAEGRPAPLRDYQREALEAWKAAGYRGMVVLPTGTGKTNLAIAAFKALGCPKTLWVSPDRTLILDTIRRLKDVHAFPEEWIGEWYGERKKMARFTITTYATLRLHPRETFDEFELVIFDEVHHSAGKVTYESIRPYLKDIKYLLGLTATPPETSPYAKEVIDDFGIVYRADISTLQKRGYLAPVVLHMHPVNLTSEEWATYEELVEKRRSISRVLKNRYGIRVEGANIGLLINRYRHDRKVLDLLYAYRRITFVDIPKLLIYTGERTTATIDLIRKHLDEPRILVFAKRIDICKQMISTLKGLGIPAEIITGETKRKDRIRLLQEFGKTYKVLFLVGVGQEGLDIPELRVLIMHSTFTTLLKNIQRVGRVLRPRPGKVAEVYVLYVPGTPDETAADKIKRLFEQTVEKIEVVNDNPYMEPPMVEEETPAEEIEDTKAMVEEPPAEAKETPRLATEKDITEAVHALPEEFTVEDVIAHLEKQGLRADRDDLIATLKTMEVQDEVVELGGGRWSKNPYKTITIGQSTFRLRKDRWGLVRRVLEAVSDLTADKEGEEVRAGAVLEDLNLEGIINDTPSEAVVKAVEDLIGELRRRFKERRIVEKEKPERPEVLVFAEALETPVEVLREKVEKETDPMRRAILRGVMEEKERLIRKLKTLPRDVLEDELARPDLKPIEKAAIKEALGQITPPPEAPPPIEVVEVPKAPVVEEKPPVSEVERRILEALEHRGYKITDLLRRTVSRLVRIMERYPNITSEERAFLKSFEETYGVHLTELAALPAPAEVPEMERLKVLARPYLSAFPIGVARGGLVSATITGFYRLTGKVYDYGELLRRERDLAWWYERVSEALEMPGLDEPRRAWLTLLKYRLEERLRPLR